MGRPHALVALVLLGGCGTSIKVIPLRQQQDLVSRSPSSVEMFTAGKPSRPFVEVAFLVAQQESNWSFDDQSALLQKLRARAGELGCDGLVITGQNNAVVGGGDSPVATLKGFQATCIVFQP